MDLARLARIPSRCNRDLRLILRDLRLILMLENWREALASEWKRTPLKRVLLRNKVVINGPETIDLEFLFHEVWVEGIYSPPGYEIRDGHIVIDVGANIGVFTTFAATRASGVQVYAYEPFPENAYWLRKNITESSLTNVKAHQQAVAGASGVRYLRADPSDWIMHSLSEKTAEGDGIGVSCVSLDEIMNKEGIERCDLLKLDCEGSEYEILQECSFDTLHRVRRIVAEFHEGTGRAGTGRGLCRFLESRSFRIDNFQDTGVGSGYMSARNTAA